MIVHMRMWWGKTATVDTSGQFLIHIVTLFIICIDIYVWSVMTLCFKSEFTGNIVKVIFAFWKRIYNTIFTVTAFAGF